MKAKSTLDPDVNVAAFPSFAEIGADIAALDGGADPFLSPPFLEAAELHGAVSRAMGWHPSHLAARGDDGTLLGLMPLYRRTHSFGDFSRDYGWAQAWRQLDRSYYPKLVTGMPYTPASGPRFLLRAEAPASTRRALAAAAIDLARDAGIDVWQFLYAVPGDIALLEELGALPRPIIQYHWQNPADGHWRDFADFLDAFTSKRRKEVRRERRRVAEQGIRVEVRHGDEIDDELWPVLHRHYRSTFERYGTPHAFSEGFFRDVAARLGRRFVAFVACRGEAAVASAICYRGGDALFGRHWGADEEIDCLHFELCQYRGIEYCLDEGLRLFEPGAGGEHKVNRGFVPTRTWSAYWIAEPRLHAAVSGFLGRERRAIDDFMASAGDDTPYRKD